MAPARAGNALEQFAGRCIGKVAVTPADAVEYKPGRAIVQRQFDKLVARGVIVPVGEGRYWLDTAAYNADIEARRRRLVPIVIVVVLIVAAAITLGYRG